MVGVVGKAALGVDAEEAWPSTVVMPIETPCPSSRGTIG